MIDRLEAARDAAAAAGAILAPYADRKPATVDTKSADIDLVTEVDRACEAAIRDVLGRRTPGVGILGEEGGGAWADEVWVVDPIDGTTNFVHGFPFYAVSIGLVRAGVPVVGVVLDVVRERRYEAVIGQGAFRVGRDGARRRLAVSAAPTLEQSLFATGFAYDRKKNAPFYLKYVRRALETGHGIRRCGAASLDLALVAEGATDAYWEWRLAPWDVAAGAVLVTEAGGCVTAIDGGPLDLAAPHTAASNGRVHDELIAMLADVSAATGG
jgi:myo-inositol-1(or 4)-monophosphatase